MFIYVSAQISKTFYFDFPLVTQGNPPLHSFNFNFVFYFDMKECCYSCLVDKKKEKRRKTRYLHFFIPIIHEHVEETQILTFVVRDTCRNASSRVVGCPTKPPKWNMANIERTGKNIYACLGKKFVLQPPVQKHCETLYIYIYIYLV